MSKPFRETRLYPVVFMIVITAFFIGVLATLFHATQPRVQAIRAYRQQLVVLGLFDLADTTTPQDSVAALYARHIAPQQKDGYTWYRAAVGDSLLGWAFPMQGSGLWGGISAMLAVSPDYTTITRLAIVDQSETPGLGARIGEDWFLTQFRGKPLVTDGKVQSYTLVPEDAAGPAPNEVRQVTGATASSRSVTQIITTNYHRIATLLELGYE